MTKTSHLTLALLCPQAMELQENETNGFVRFKSVSKNGSHRKERDLYPEHIRAKLEKVPMTANVTKQTPKERSSSEIAASADKLRAELAEIEKKRKALAERGSTKVGVAAASAPPPPTFKKSKR